MKTKNIKKSVRKEIAPFINRLKKEKYIQGVVLLGGLGKRNFLDEYSDVDICAFVGKKDKEKFPLPFEFYFKTKERLLEFNIHQQIIEDEEEREEWDHSKIEAYSRGKIIYDPTGRVAKLIKKKIKFDKKFAYNRLIWILQQYVWRGQIHAIRAYNRGYPEAAHDLLNQCQDLLLEAIYLLNEKYPPHKKWILAFLEDLPKKYSSLRDSFKKAMIIKAFTLKDIKRRTSELDKIYFKIKKTVLNKFPNFPANPYEYYYRNFVQLNRETKVDELLKYLDFKKIASNYSLQEIKGALCFNLVTSKSLLNKLFLSSDITKQTSDKYKNEFRRNDKYGKKG